MLTEPVDISRLTCEECATPGADAAWPRQNSSGYWTCSVCFHLTYGYGFIR
jgi:hypothetical protein